MAVGMNSIGNYSAYGLNAARQNKTVLAKTSESKSENINSDEKEFFAKMYPAKQTEIMEYYYEKNGKMNGIALGTNIDRRG